MKTVSIEMIESWNLSVAKKDKTNLKQYFPSVTGYVSDAVRPTEGTTFVLSNPPLPRISFFSIY